MQRVEFALGLDGRQPSAGIPGLPECLRPRDPVCVVDSAFDRGERLASHRNRDHRRLPRGVCPGILSLIFRLAGVHSRLLDVIRNCQGTRPADRCADREARVKRFSLGYTVTVLLLSATLAGYALSERRKPDFLVQPLDTVDQQIAGWKMT